MTSDWPTKRLSIAGLHLDAKNPRLGRETLARSPREVVKHLFEHDKALEVAQSIAARGYFPNEPLLAIKEDGRTVVVEGNRRLAALKALKEPGLLDGALQRQLERLARQVEDPATISTVPVTLAPSRRATDRQLAGRHIGTPVLPWQAENRASFILDKLSEGYTNDQLRDQLGFSLADIQAARQTRAIADMARSLDLPEEIKAKLDSPRAKLFTTLERVFDSTVGREYLRVDPDPNHGLRGTTSRSEFIRGFTKLVTDVVLGRQSSRTLNTNENIRQYFESWKPTERPAKRDGSFVPADIIHGRSIASPSRAPKPEAAPTRGSRLSASVVPRSLKVRYGHDRLKDMRNELVRLKRDKYPNAGAVMLRVFLEIAVVDYLTRTKELPEIVKKIESKGGKVSYATPTMRQLVPEINRIADTRLGRADAVKVKKALHYDPSAPFTISDLHGFVHQTDFPSPRDILQFWNRIEPLLRLLLEDEPKASSE